MKIDLQPFLSPLSLKDHCWNYTDADTQYLTHNIHRYSGKFIPQIANKVIQNISLPGELILDPYCGSGTTLVEAALLDRKAIGIDINPLAILIAKAKVTPVEPIALEKLQKLFAEIIGVMQNGYAQDLLSQKSYKYLFDAIASDPRSQDEWFKKWFSEPNLSELIMLDLEINRIEDSSLRNVARVAFSDILRRCSNAHSGYPNVMFDKAAGKKSSPSKIFLNALEKVCRLVVSLSEVPAKWDQVQAQIGDAQKIEIDDGSVDAIVTHPPYIGSIPYAEYGLLSLKWLGTDPKQLDNVLTGGRRQSSDVVIRFANAYQAMLNESWRVLRSGRYAFLMVGNPVVKGEIINLEKMTIELAKKAGFSTVLKTKRTGSNRRANKMGEESLLFFQK